MMCIVFQRRVVLRAQTDSLINTLHEHLGFPLKVAGVHMQVCGRRMFYDAVPQRRQVNCNIPSGFNFNFNKLIAITVRSPLPASSRVSKALRPAHKYPLLFINIIKVIYGAWAEDTRKMFSSLVFCEDVECNPSGAKTWENGWKTTMSTSTQNGKFSLRGHNSYISHISKRFIWQICLPLSKSGLLQQFWDLISLQLNSIFEFPFQLGVRTCVLGLNDEIPLHLQNRDLLHILTRKFILSRGISEDPLRTVLSIIPLEAFSTAMKDKPFLFYRIWNPFFDYLGTSESKRLKASLFDLDKRSVLVQQAVFVDEFL